MLTTTIQPTPTTSKQIRSALAGIEPVIVPDYDADVQDRFHFVGVRAGVCINGELRQSPGYWGVASDAPKEYLTELFERECEALIKELTDEANNLDDQNLGRRRINGLAELIKIDRPKGISFEEWAGLVAHAAAEDIFQASADLRDCQQVLKGDRETYRQCRSAFEAREKCLTAKIEQVQP